jgi:hypothetical protein
MEVKKMEDGIEVLVPDEEEAKESGLEYRTIEGVGTFVAINSLKELMHFLTTWNTYNAGEDGWFKTCILTSQLLALH